MFVQSLISLVECAASYEVSLYFSEIYLTRILSGLHFASRLPLLNPTSEWSRMNEFYSLQVLLSSKCIQFLMVRNKWVHFLCSLKLKLWVIVFPWPKRSWGKCKDLFFMNSWPRSYAFDPLCSTLIFQNQSIILSTCGYCHQISEYYQP